MTNENKSENTIDLTVGDGILDIASDEQNKKFIFLRTDRYLPTSDDIYVSESQVRRFGLRQGDFISGQVRPPKETEKYRGLVRIEQVNGLEPNQIKSRPNFHSLVAKLPITPIELDPETDALSSPVIGQVSKIKFGQLGLIIIPLQNKGTDLIKAIANGISEQYPQAQVLILVIGGSPTTIADVNSSVRATIISSKSNDSPEDQVKISELLIQHARRYVENGQEVVVLVDSISKLGQSYLNTSTKSLSVELDNFCIVGNFENGGSLTIIGTLEIQAHTPAEDTIFKALRNHRDLIEVDLGSKKPSYNNISYHRVFGTPYQDLEISDVFVLMPLKEELKNVYEDHIKTVVEQMSLTIKRSDDIFSTGTIMADIWTSIRDAKIVIADCTDRNPNVFYEVGIAHAIEKPVILITQKRQDIPFDLQHLRIIEYAFTPPGMIIFERHLESTLRDLLGKVDIY